MVDHHKLWKILKEIGIPDHLSCLLRNMYASQEATEPDMEQWTGSKLEKDYIKAVYCHPACLNYIQDTSCKMSGWMNHKLESRLPGEISTTLDVQLIPLYNGRKQRGTKEPLDEGESEKAGLKLSIQKKKIMTYSPITSQQIDGGESGNSDRFYFLGLQNHYKQ